METIIMSLRIPLRDQDTGCSGARATQRLRLRIGRYTKRHKPHLEPLEGRLLLAAGDLDPSFGTGGEVMTDFAGPTRNFGNGVAVQADGKLVVVGFAPSGAGVGDFALARYNADGSLDTSFGTGGRVTTGFSAGGAGAYAVALQSDGKIVAAGKVSTVDGVSDFALARYNADGSLDTSFGSGGKVTTDFGSRIDWASCVLIQGDGKIVAVGNATTTANYDFALARYTPAGALDTSFGSGGKVTTDFSRSSIDTAYAATLQSDGKIVAAGISSGSPSYDFAVARYSTSGGLDTGFGNRGKVVTDFSGFDDYAYDVTLQSDGKIVAAGTSYSNKTSEDFALERYTASGALDSTFGVGGKVTTDFIGPTQNYGQGMAIQGDGKILVGGYTSDGIQSSYMSLARVNSDGSLDAGFGSGGLVNVDFGFHHDDRASAVAIQSDGKILMVGTATGSSTGDDFALVRLTATGGLDSSFGTGGKVTTDFSKGPDQAFAVAIQSDGKIVVAGSARTSSTEYDFALARYNANGSLDTTFGSRGKVTTAFAPSLNAGVYGLILQGDGKIVAVGYGFNGSHADFAVARYTSGGALDATFGSGGKVMTDFNSYDDYAHSVAIQTDGKVVVAGSAVGSSTGEDFALARYNTNGSLDTSFGSGGKVTTDFTGNADEAHGLAIQSDGRIVAAGSALSGTDSTSSDFGLVRYNADGSVDTAFGAGGRVTTDFSGNEDRAFGVAVQSDGKIVAAGYASINVGYNHFAVARYAGTSAPAPVALRGAITELPGAGLSPLAHGELRRVISPANADAAASFPQGPLGAISDITPWVTVSRRKAHGHQVTGELDFLLTVSDREGFN
jgi:uncharacterized delta-60 repeat protein